MMEKTTAKSPEMEKLLNEFTELDAKLSKVNKKIEQLEGKENP